MARGQYIDPRAARITFQQYAEKWVTHAPDPNTQASMEAQFRLHAYPYLGSRPLGSFQPAPIRDWVRQLQENGVRGSYARTIYSHVRAALSAAVDDGHLPRTRAPLAQSVHRLWTTSTSCPGRRNGSSPSGPACPSATEPWSTWVAAAAFGKGRSWAWPSTRSTSSRTPSTWSSSSS
ncbi:hypothetical protein GCM10010360_51240 [Streptomyces nogalater]